jgi:ribosomal protein S18 acetylase RimI-like enzyme
MEHMPVSLRKAADAGQVSGIVKKSILSIYPRFYPEAVVNFFLRYHSEAELEKAFADEDVYLVIASGAVVGTGSVRYDEIERLYILPEYRRLGYGSAALELLERKVFAAFPAAYVDASFPAEHLYLRRGYRLLSCDTEKISRQGDTLCWNRLCKDNPANAADGQTLSGNCRIRPLNRAEYGLLEKFLYLAIYQPAGSPALPRDIIKKPELSAYIQNFGQAGDFCVAAEENGSVAGAAWARLFSGDAKGYGHCGGDTPELAISVEPALRGRGIGSRLLRALIAILKSKGYARVSLSVANGNRAYNLYRRLGFQIVEAKAGEYVMALQLDYTV